MAEANRRKELLDILAAQIAAIHRSHPVRVAIDGVDAAGKTILADELVAPIQQCGRPVIRASMDGFHNPPGVRYQCGSESPQGYYLDSFDLEAFRDSLLIPLGPGGSRQYRRAIYDYRKDSPVYQPLASADPKAVLLCDGIFLLRPELYQDWDFKIFVKVDFMVALERILTRELPASARSAEIQALKQRVFRRYIPGQQIYLQQARPSEVATVVVVNDDWSNPLLEK